MFVHLTIFLLYRVVNGEHEIEASFYSSDLVPDVISAPPKQPLNISFGDVVINIGKKLEFDNMKGTPTLSWPNQDDKFYTFLMADADVPSRQSHEGRSHLIWLVVNIQGDNIKSGYVISHKLKVYEPLTDMHRIYFLVYEQPKYIEFDEELSDSEERHSFSPEEFSKRYDLGAPFAGNYFVAKIFSIQYPHNQYARVPKEYEDATEHQFISSFND